MLTNIPSFLEDEETTETLKDVPSKPQKKNQVVDANSTAEGDSKLGINKESNKASNSQSVMRFGAVAEEQKESGKKAELSA